MVLCHGPAAWHHAKAWPRPRHNPCVDPATRRVTTAAMQSACDRPFRAQFCSEFQAIRSQVWCSRTVGVRTAGTGTLATSGLDDRADCKVVFLVCENRMSSVRYADIAWPRVMGAGSQMHLSRLQQSKKPWQTRGMIFFAEARTAFY